MLGIQINEAKAPWIMFETRAVEDRTESIKQGRYVAKDIDHVLITPHGSKDRIERVVSEWFEHLDGEARSGRFSADWLRQYRQAYAAWKEGKQLPLNGTPIINWPLLSPSQVQLMQSLHILTVEVLAEANEETIRRLGMGGRTLVQKAREFLAQTATGKSTEEVVALQAKVEGLEGIVERQAEQINTLMAQLKAQNVVGAQEPSMGLASGGNGIGASDLLDNDPPAPAGKPRKL
jgi:hypothetical protein